MSIPRLNKETSLFSHSHSIEAGIRVLTDSVDSFVNMEDTYTDLNGDTVANKAASRIKQNADNIALRVEKNDIISSINQSPEAITIDASRVNIAGAAIFTSGSLSKVVRTSSEQWYSSTSPTSRAGGAWSTVQPDISAGRYLWTRTYYSYSDGSSEYRPSEGGICVTPPTDIADTVKSVDVEYAQTTSSTAQPTSGWSTVAPTVAAGKYLWTRTKTVLSDNSTTYTRATCISGDNGMAVTSAREQYYLSSSYSATIDGTWSDDCPAWENGMYLWTRTFVTYANGHSAGVNATLATALNDACAKADTAISGVDVEYAQATSATVAPTDGWSTTAPRIASGRYLWTRTKTTYSSGASPTYTDAACISGDDGKLVKSAKEQYYLSTSSTAQSGGTWTDACPAWASDRYIWTRTHLTYADGTTGAANVTLATALNDANRKANATITDLDVEYADSTSSTTPPSDGWQTSAPAWQAGHYIWQRTKTVTPAGTSYSQPVCISGRDGVDGTGVTVSRVAYGTSASADVEPSSWSTTTPTSMAQGSWMWIKTTYSDGSTSTSKSYIGTDGEDGKSVYVQSNVKSGDTTTIVLADSDGNESTIVIRDGEDGADGIAGKNGYVHTAWANSADGSSGFSTTDSADKKYLGVYTDNTAADSTDRTKYSWSLIKGDKGDAGADGEDGRGVKSTTIHYGTSASASAEPSSWSTTAPASIAKGEWLWARTTVTYTDNTTSVSFSKSYVGTDGDDGTSIHVTSSTKSGGTTTVKLSDGTTLTIVDGEDGSDGTNGANGYVHTAWANSANGQTDFSTTVSANKKYLGVYTDNVAADSTSPSAYSWSLIKGADGAAAYTYSINCNPSALVRAADGTLSPSSVSFSATRTQGTGSPLAYYGRLVIAEHDGSSWTDWYTGTFDEAARAYSPHNTAKAVRCNLYLAGGTTTLLDTQTVPILSDGATGAAGADGKDGKDGKDGRDGTSVTVSEIEYGVADNASTAPTYSTTVPTSIAKGKWLWVRTTYSDGSTAVNKSYVGTDGEDGTSIYVTSSSKVNGVTTVRLSDGTTMTINDGEDGTDGAKGANGYIHTAWANSSDGSQGFSTTESANKLYLGVYTDNTAADSTDHTKYSWSLIKGSDGASPNVYTVKATPAALVRSAGRTETSSVSTVHIGSNAIITSSTGDVTTPLDGSFEFSVTTVGDGLTYLWQYMLANKTTWSNFGGTPHTATLTRTNIPARLDGMRVRCVVTDSSGATETSDEATLHIGSGLITRGPNSVYIAVGDTMRLEVGVVGTNYGFLWQYQWADEDVWHNFSGATHTAVLTRTDVPASWDGLKVRCIVTEPAGMLSPSSVAFSVTRTQGTDNPTAYAGRMVIAEFDGTTWANKYTSSSDESSKSYSPTATAKVVRCNLYLAGGTDTLLDTQSVSIASNGADGADGIDGADAYTVMLTNESHTFAGSATAAIASSTTSQVIAYKGTTRVAATIGNIVGAPAGMSTSITNNGSMTAAMTVSVTTALETRDGVLMVPVTVDGNAFSLMFSWTVALAGAKGDTGATGADGRGIVSIEEQYYLSTSNTERVGGSWVTTPPPYETGKYYWTRSKIIYDSGNPNYSWTEITLANDITSIANVANGASLRHQTIWRSATSGTNSVSGTTNWVTDATGAQNKWTAVRPVYNSAFPILFTATQSQTMSQSGLTTCKCTTPVKDDTTTVIDGGHVTTGTIDASKVNVTNISASEISSGTLSADRIGAKSVNADKLAANAVTAEKILTNAVTTAKIDALAVTADKVAAGAITADKVSAGAITTAKLAASAVTAEKISTGAITAEKIGAGAVTADKIKANSLTVGLMDPSLMKTMSWYAESTTAASTATKVATIIPNVSSFTLSEGVCVRVKFSYTNSASVSTLALNVNSTGALSVVYTASGGGVSPIPVRGFIQAGRVYEFVYDGTYWVLQYGNDTFGKTRYESNILAAANISAGRIICGTRDGYRNLTAEATFDMSYPLLYAGKAITAGGTGNDNYSRADNVSYSNNVSVTGGAANKVVYLKGELQGNTFHVANSAWLTTNVPTSDDGFKYIPLGIMSTSSVGYFEPSNAIWEYLDGEFGPSSFRESSLAAKTASYYVSEFGGGIRVHPKDEYDDNYLSIHSHGINVFREGVSVAFFGETVRVGALDSTNMTIDEDGFSMRRGIRALARFSDSVSLGMSQMTRNALTFRDYERNNYVYFSDLRDSDTHITRVTETIIGDGALLYHEARLSYADGGYVSVSFDGGSYEHTIDTSEHWIEVDIDKPLAVGHRMYLTYDTDSTEAKAFTLGVRKKNSVVGASSYALGFDTTAEGVHSYALGHNATASGGDSCAIGLDAVAGADDTIAIGTDAHATAPTAIAIGIGAVASAPFARAIGGGASGYASVTLGGNASGPNSRSLVETATASGDFAVAMGYICTASGAHSFADGQGTNASGVCSHASGRSTNASYENQFVCGMFNLPTSGDLFEVGNGNGGSYRSNAFSVTNDGIAYVGSTQVSSDGRVKSEVEPIDGGDALSLVMGLSPKSYVKFGRRELGFVAQDVEALAFGDVLVDESPNFGYDDFRNLSYDGLIAPIVSVEQSLVTKLGDACERIGRLEAENAELRSRLHELEGRVDMLLRAIGDDSR